MGFTKKVVFTNNLFFIFTFDGVLYDNTPSFCYTCLLIEPTLVNVENSETTKRKIMNFNDYYNKIYELYGTVTRTRGCFLYTKKGERLTDLYQENGRAILGWDGKNATTFFKNTLSKGLVGSFITEDKKRLEKSISILLDSKRRCFYFSSKMNALKSGLLLDNENTTIFIPWATKQENAKTSTCVIITPPFPWTQNIFILAVLEDKMNENIFFENTIKIPFALENAITRSVYNLIGALNERKETDFFIYDTVLTKYWTRNGPYLFPKIKQENYDDFVLYCMNKKILINPEYDKSIIPFGADKGVFTLLKNSPFNK